ncbi:MAG: GntR family transcriptional regulator [Meiothermus sp.]
MLAPQTDEAYRRLRRLILSLELRPGEPLVERKLEERLSVSRTPIRAAIQKLAREGLVHRTGRVYSVAPVDVAELDEAFAFRKLLETGAVRLAAAQKPDTRELHELLTALRERLDPEAELGKATDFHLALARLSGNRFLVESLSAVLGRIYRARFLEITSPQGVKQAQADHIRLVELVQTGQGEAAARLMEEHLERSRQRLLEGLEGSSVGHILLARR